MPDPVRPVRATYRLQVHPGFTLDDAAGLAEYLADLGVSHYYLSPIFEAAVGSMHGYDVVDPGHVSDAIGGPDAFGRLVAAAHGAGLGLVLDIVPHHMAIGDRRNRWWWDVLRFGPTARYAAHFDIDWEAPERRLREKVVLPILGDHYGRVLEQGGIRLEPDEEEIAVVQVGGPGGAVVPLAPCTVGDVVVAAAERLGDDELGLLGRALQATEREDVDAATREADARAVCARVRERRADAELDRALSRALGEVNLDVDALDALLERQHYRLARWQVASQELDYRRFFDVNSLVALRSERPEVFQDSHRCVLALVERDEVDGLRVDHVDGLVDPEAYLRRLRGEALEAWIVVEKILLTGESLRRSWPVDGTTGYDFATAVTGLLLHPAGVPAVVDGYRRLTGDELPWDEHARIAKRLVLSSVLGSDVARLTEVLVRICERRRRLRDFTRSELHDALVEVAVHTHGYRSYAFAGEGAAPRVQDADREYVLHAVAAAREANPQLDPEVFDLVAAVLTFQGMPDADERELALRFQQLTGPATAKGEEDTALYRWVPLLALNDVGADPSRGARSPGEIHEVVGHLAAEWPRTMVTTSTHDTKRSEDVRARLAALPEVAGEWLELVEASGAWGPAQAVDAHTRWFVVQTLVGAWPIPLERVWPVVQKSLREAKLRTSWLRPDAEYEEQVHAFVAAVLDDAARGQVEELVARIAPAGWHSGLVQAALRLTMVGVPDTYQGTEWWDLSLVDPDNRRPVDYELRRRALAEVGAAPMARWWRDDPADGRAKLALVRDLLHLRARRPHDLGPGASYEAVALDAPEPASGIAFRRGAGVLVAAALHPLAGPPWWKEAGLDVPEGTWRDVCSGRDVAAGRTTLADLLDGAPVAVLERTDG